MIVRKAMPNDADEICQVLRRSINELCRADHADEPVLLSCWLQNKTPENVGLWIAQQDSCMLVAIENDLVIGVGAVTGSGQITLNYVSPDARFRGVSRAILFALETKAREQGNQYCTLSSTKTAHRFYLASGYEEIYPLKNRSATSEIRMAKSLSSKNSK